MNELLSIERDLAGVLELPDLAGQILDRLQRLIGASGATISYYDRPGGKPTLLGGPLERMMLEYPADLFAEDPIPSFNLAMPPGLFLVTGEGFDFAAFAKGRPYLDYYRPRDIGYMFGVRPTGLRYGSLHMFGLMFCMPTLPRRFAPVQLGKLRHLEVPLRTAAGRIARFRALDHRRDILCQLLERRQGAVVIWNADGRLVWTSAAARALVGGLGGGDFERAAALAWRQLRRTEAGSRDAMLGRARHLRSHRGEPLIVEFSWVTSSEQRPWLVAELRSAVRNEGLERLTQAEARVLRLLARGLSYKEIGETLTVSGETVKTHVGRILSKLEVRSRAKAARVASEAWGAEKQLR